MTQVVTSPCAFAARCDSVTPAKECQLDVSAGRTRPCREGTLLGLKRTT